MSGETRIVLADDHPIVLSGLRNLLSQEGDFKLVGEATSGAEALKIIRECKPDLVVLDISMAEPNGIAVSRRIGQELPSVKVLILTFHEDRAYLQQAIDARWRLPLENVRCRESCSRHKGGNYRRSLRRPCHSQPPLRIRPKAGRRIERWAAARFVIMSGKDDTPGCSRGERI